MDRKRKTRSWRTHIRELEVRASASCVEDSAQGVSAALESLARNQKRSTPRSSLTPSAPSIVTAGDDCDAAAAAREHSRAGRKARAAGPRLTLGLLNGLSGLPVQLRWWTRIGSSGCFMRRASASSLSTLGFRSWEQ
eukprot:scaffold19407_cov69-Phaeocystis_antarctica.AAC.4